MSKSTYDYLKDLQTQLGFLNEFIHESPDAFRTEMKTQYAVLRSFEIIGEIVKRLPPETLQSHPEVNWKQVKGLRDFLAHNYDLVDLDLVGIAIDDLPKLLAAVNAMELQYRPATQENDLEQSGL